MSMKGSDASCIPLCLLHHDQLDGRVPLAGGVGRGLFCRLYSIDLERTAAWFFERWSNSNA